MNGIGILEINSIVCILIAGDVEDSESYKNTNSGVGLIHDVSESDLLGVLWSFCEINEKWGW